MKCKLKIRPKSELKRSWWKFKEGVAVITFGIVGIVVCIWLLVGAGAGIGFLLDGFKGDIHISFYVAAIIDVILLFGLSVYLVGKVFFTCEKT